MKSLHPRPSIEVTDTFFAHTWKGGWTYIKTVVDVVHEPVIILDKELRVRAANESFYRVFKVAVHNTEGKIIYDLGNGQWDIPALHTLLKKVLEDDTFFKGFEVRHQFPGIGEKVMLLNARQIHFLDPIATKGFPPIIMLAIEDITELMTIAAKVSHATRQQDR